MPIAALLMSALLLNSGWIPFDPFDRDGDLRTELDVPDVPIAASGIDGDLPPSAGSRVNDAAGPGDEAPIRKFRVALAPPDFDESERLGAIAYPAFHAYLLEELKAIRHLEIVELTEATDELTPEDADFYLETGGERHPGPPPTWTFRVRWIAMREGTATWAKVHDSTNTELLEVTAQEAAESLRRYPFPPADSRTVELQSIALDGDRPEPERFDALLELHDIPKRYEFVGRDERRMAAVAGTAIVLNSPDPEIRGRTWQAMEGVEDSYLIGPLVDSALLDTSAFVRVEAMKLLVREYEDDTRTESTLLHALANDHSPEVQTHARWETSDDTERRRYLVATLANADLTDAARLELIVADVTNIRDFIDQRAIRSLIDIASRATATSELNTGAGEPGGVPASDVVPFLLEFLEDSTVDMYVRGNIASALANHLDEPGVRESFENLMSSACSNVRNARFPCWLVSGALERTRNQTR
jgi:hypothetical protein